MSSVEFINMELLHLTPPDKIFKRTNTNKVQLTVNQNKIIPFDNQLPYQTHSIS